MKIIQVVCVVIIFFCSIQQGRTAPFSKNSITVYVSNFYPYDKCSLIEYDLSGTKIQYVANISCSANKGVQLDESGTLLVAATVSGTDNKINVYDPNGKLVDATTVPSANIDVQYPALSGSDLWLQDNFKISYTTRGSSGPPVTQNIAPTTWGGLQTSFGMVQLVDSTLFFVNKMTRELLKMEPVVNTGTGPAVKVVGTVTWFYVHKGASIYILAGFSAQVTTPTLTKYSYQNGVATLQYSINLPFTADAVIAITAMDVDSTTYVLLVYKQFGSFIIGRYTDTGSTFDSLTTVVQLVDDFRSLSPSPKATCSDGFKDQDETDVDCGGAICNACADSGTCLLNSDCSSGFCNVYGVCATPTCDDGEKNQDETDVDCGGSCSKNCDDGKGCKAGGDCTSGVCNTDAGTCTAPSCDDNVMNGAETDIDCGGGGFYNCTGCAIEKMCSLNSDCAGYKCLSNLCAASCQDNILNQDETDIDCGGNNCNPCANDKTCLSDTDCVNNFCTPDSTVCKTATCQDTYQNQDETDIDCGGSTCSKCAVGKKCVMDSDCDSNNCASDTCANPPVTSPIDAPVTVPINAPVNSTPTKQKPVSVGTIIKASFCFFIFVVLAVIV